ncbi:interferon-induced very large GTPase 1-like isoform X2 [Cololabis saira]|uniref:interferon-induced very large GTPase 1-like isoform X2 n=1 Tax=Cololabis saira TaxID=129043 RepID=UPI002AD5A782|nr:interferon-induced very large GTPase 1-like isoform X2 [Cololabis saira]
MTYRSDDYTVKRWLKATLKNLDSSGLKEFKWYLNNAEESEDGFNPIPLGPLEKADALDTGNLMMQWYSTKAREVAEMILKMMKSEKEKPVVQDGPVSPAGATEPVPPAGIKVSNVTRDSLSLQWDPPAGEVESCIVTCCSGGETVEKKTTKTNSVTFSSLKPGVSYSLHVSAQLRNGTTSTPASITAQTEPVPPTGIKVSNVTRDSLSLQWDPGIPAGEVESCIVTCCSGGETVEKRTTKTNSVTFSSLKPGVSYSLHVSAQLRNGTTSTPASITAQTEPVPPTGIKVSNVTRDSLSLQWDPGIPAGEVESCIVTCCSGGETVEKRTTKTNSVTFSSLKPGVSYSLHVSAQLRNGTTSTPASITAQTEIDLKSLLEDLGLTPFYREKLTLSKILEIDKKTITDVPVKSKSDLPWYFLKKLMMVNVTARNMNCDDLSGTELDFSHLLASPNTGDTVNPLDIITALFLCSDAFVQQEMALKMAMCQLSVPLLLPSCDTEQCTLMLWAMRDIIKKYRPSAFSQSKGFIEERIVDSQVPMISFVRLGNCSLSKSEILNKLLSNSQQYHDTFVHRNMEGGDSPKRISNGLTEITWYLPGGNTDIDLFNQPVAVANLHGDIASFETQYSFLCQTSAAVFVFFDHSESECKILTNQNQKAQIFLVGNSESKNFRLETLKIVATALNLTASNCILKKKQQNIADFIKRLRKTVRDVVENTQMKMPIAHMAEIAHELGILVDENSPECQAGKKSADAITEEIQDLLRYKEQQLPLQGQIWKELTHLEKEEFRLKEVGSKNIEMYKSELKQQKEKLRNKQNSCDLSPAMACFINAISSPGIERCYFLKWMRMNLDNVSCLKLSVLRELYKEKCKDYYANKEEVKGIDRQLSNSSLGTEHFFREMGQIYEASLSLPETHPSRQQLQHLPKLCAQLLLDGFPLELVDGDASNIPLRWVSDVLSQLNHLVFPKNRIRVVTVLGIQSTGKSTLLNTMFGVQFAVSSGPCTRGAFMLLIRLNKDVKREFGCDFMVIIDTEGLKSPELSQLDYSYDHDNELATLVVGLSDITIINIAMENSTEMKDILQIVVHAFLRMKEVGKKTKCQFVHQNVPDVSAPEKNLRGRELLLEQLNERTQAAAKMEKREENRSFTDVMEYSPDTGTCYVPGLWNGNPPMAPVNVGYSQTLYELKKNIIQQLGECVSANDLLAFKEWMTSLWNAVKHENFIFSFRNSLVVDAYMKLCREFNKWEWEFQKSMYNWISNAERKISKFGTVAAKCQISDMEEFLTQLKHEASTDLSKWEMKLLDNLEEYFKQRHGHVYLVEGYKEEFKNSAKSLRRELESSVVNQLRAAADIKRGLKEVDKIKDNHTKEIEKAVNKLITECRKKNVQMTDRELNKEFDKMWSETLRKMSFSGLKRTDVFTDVSHCLRENVEKKGSHACYLLSRKPLQECGLEPFMYKPEGWGETVKNTFKGWFTKDLVKARQKVADNIIAACQDSVTDRKKRKTNYHNTYIQEILRIIDEMLNKTDVDTGIEFEVPLKQHICAVAARNFQIMQEDFIQANDPLILLDKNKEKFCADFRDVFHERDQCQKKAEEFIEQCLKPAVEDFVYHFLGLNITEEMMTSKAFSTRTFFQGSVLLDLLSKKDFNSYRSCIRNYEDYVKTWILEQIKEHFSDTTKTSGYEEEHLKSSIKNIKDAMEKAKSEKSADLKTFVEHICKELGDKLVISQDALGAFMILNNTDQEQFADWLTESVEKMEETLKKKFKDTTFERKLEHLRVNPQTELFNRVVGCGKQCPFCEVPCEAGGGEHEEHHASLHRPRGLGGYSGVSSGKLSTDICTSLVISDRRFSGSATNDEWHPFKSYREIYPDWHIPPDGSLEASDFWKYVMNKYNREFAEAYDAKPADIPGPWKKITKQQAEKSLKNSFNLS